MTNEKIIVFYQADCNFCNACRRFIERRDRKSRCVFRDIKESDYALDKVSGFESIVVIEGEHTYTKFLACLRIGEHLKNPWPHIMWVLRIIPKPIGDLGYDFVSNHRNFLINLTKR